MEHIYYVIVNCYKLSKNYNIVIKFNADRSGVVNIFTIKEPFQLNFQREKYNESRKNSFLWTNKLLFVFEDYLLWGISTFLN